MTLTTLQAGRAVAAIMVVFFHAQAFFFPAKLYPGVVISPVFQIGYSGVEFFFVLSGFLMALIHTKDIGNPGRAGNFFRKRTTRIYPFYWVVLSVLVIAYNLLPSLGPEQAHDPIKVLNAYLLLRMPDDFIITAAWTLSHEILFYAFFLLLIANATVGGIAMGLWIIAILVSIAIEPGYPFSFVFSYYNLLFFFGMAAAYLFPRLGLRAAAGLSILGFIAFLSVGLTEAYGVWPAGFAMRTIGFGLAGTCIVAGLARLESAKRVRSPRILTFLGDASYSIYLIHGPALGLLTWIAAKLGLNHHFAAPVLYFPIVTLAVLAGVAGHLIIERPVLAFFRKQPNAAPRTSTVP